ncbi:Uncharacterized protein AC500_3291 [Pseudomonas amygdali pv. lachrymans]|nr:Uncharacterized protein AC500_3291 [Pseudomonas amygdali pv. lachrymans]
MPVDCRSHSAWEFCVIQRFCDIRWIGVRLKSSFRPSDYRSSRSGVGMQFVTLCVTRRFCGVRWIGVPAQVTFGHRANPK